jgi:CheY-like chemotaxis protein
MKQRGRKPSILYVESHQRNRDFCTQVLERSNYQVTKALQDNALKIAKTEAFDLYIVDLRLSNGFALDLCERLRQLDRSTPIILCSEDSTGLRKAESFPRNEPQIKTCSPAELFQAVVHLIAVRTSIVE